MTVAATSARLKVMIILSIIGRAKPDHTPCRFALRNGSPSPLSPPAPVSLGPGGRAEHELSLDEMICNSE